MGGLAFSSGPEALYTPRMPREVYDHVKSHCFRVLKELYNVVDSPIDGPGKTSFGDIDVLLHGPKTPISSREETLSTLQQALDASKMIVEGSEEISIHLAVPWPSEMDGQDVSLDHQSHDPHRAAEPDDRPPRPEGPPHSGEEPQAKHIQIDVRVCSDLHRLRWMLFKHAHGDIWNLIGASIRPYGLTVDEQALWLRVPEIEKANRKRAKVALTSDPDTILDFLGLPASEYWSGSFEDSHSMFEYVARCRMFCVPPVADSESGHEGLPNQETSEGGSAEDRRKLKANDRRRMNLRPAFRKWIDEFYPECRQRGRFLEKGTSREEVTQEAFARFGVEAEFEQRRRDFLLEQQRDFIWTNVIKTAIPYPEDMFDTRALQYRGTVVKALKRIILENDDRYGIACPADLKDDDGFFVIENVVDFITRQKDEVHRVALEQQHAAYLEKQARKQAEAAVEPKQEDSAAQPSSA